MEEKGGTKNYNRWRKKVGPKITTDGGKRLDQKLQPMEEKGGTKNQN